MIRNAQIADLPGIRACAERLHELSPYRDVPSDLQTFASTLGQCISNAFGFAMVAVKISQDKGDESGGTLQGEITGFLLGCAVPLWFSKKRSASDIVTYAESPGDGYRMMKKFVDWAWSLPNVVEITMAQSSGIDIERTDVLYERVGLKRVGSIYTAVREDAAAEVAA